MLAIAATRRYYPPRPRLPSPQRLLIGYFAWPIEKSDPLRGETPGKLCGQKARVAWNYRNAHFFDG
jgi:hypothetical protein